MSLYKGTCAVIVLSVPRLAQDQLSGVFPGLGIFSLKCICNVGASHSECS